MKLFNKNNIAILLTYLLLAFPFFYFIYKFGVLLKGYDDANSYLILFRDLDPKGVPAPFNMRLISPILIHLLHGTGLFYITECAIDAFPAVDKSYYFSNIFFNFICVTLTCHSIFLTFSKLGFSKVLSFLSGVLYLLGFGTIFYMFMPGVDALSILLFTWLLFFYQKKSYWVLPFFIAFIFQREYYFLFFIILAILDYIKQGRIKYFIHIFLASLICWTVYFLLRKYVFYSPRWNFNTEPGSLLENIINMKLDLFTMFRQTIMTMNIYFIYILILVYKKINGFKIDSYHFYITIVLFVQITILSIATTAGNNNGRYFYLATPFFLFLILKELTPMIRIEFNSTKS